MSDFQEDMQCLADEMGFDLKKLPYGYQFRVGKQILNYYHTTKTVVICKPKSKQEVIKFVPISSVKTMLKGMKKEVSVKRQLTGDKAIALVMSGVEIKHKKIGEKDWRKDNIQNLPVSAFMNGNFIFKLDVKK